MLNPILETAIGVFFIYMLLSMICSAIQEWIAALFALRAKTLREGVGNLLCHDQNLVAQIYDHPLIKGLSRKSWWDKVSRREPRPSYISSEVFAQALLSSAGMTQETAAAGAVPVRASNGQPLSEDTQRLLNTFLAYSDHPESLRANVEDWYNDAMARVSGWYKRKAQGIILGIALAIALVANADTVMLIRAFWHDPAIRAAAVAAATDYVNTHQRQPSPQQQAQARQKNLENLFPSVSDDKPAPVPPPEAQFRAASQNLADTFTEVRAQLDRTRVPLGWCKAPRAPNVAPGAASDQIASAASACAPGQSCPHGWREWVLKIGGLLVTMIALSQGAPFWFDLLQKIVNLRLAGSNPAEAKKK